MSDATLDATPHDPWAEFDACDISASTAEDAVAGVVPRWVARPRTTDEVAALLRVAHAHGLAVVARGAGTKQDWGLPPRALDLVVDTTGLDEVFDYAPFDLVLRVGAGVTLETIETRLAEHGQRLGIDPPRRGTIGGTVATGVTGPMRLAHLAVRDLVIGMTFVRADGVVAKAGGKVVKNVAGYDVAKLFTGAYGTLGIITEVGFRLHPRAEATQWIGGQVPIPQLAQVLGALAQDQVVPSAVEVDVPVDGRSSVVVQLDGTAAGLTGRAARVRELFEGAVGAGAVDTIDTAGAPPGWWGTEPPGAALLKVTHVIGRAAALAQALREAGDAAGVRVAYRGSPLVGTAWVGVEGLEGEAGSAAFARFVEEARAATMRLEGTLTVVSAPPSWRDAVDVWGPVPGLELMRAVKAQFDPDAVLASGRFVGGI